MEGEIQVSEFSITDDTINVEIEIKKRSKLFDLIRKLLEEVSDL